MRIQLNHPPISTKKMPPSYADRDLLRYSTNELLRVLCFHIALDGLKCDLKPLLEIERPKVESIALFFPQKNTKPFIVFYNDVMDLLGAQRYVPERKPMLVEATHQVAEENTEVMQKLCCSALEKMAVKDEYLVSVLLHCQGFSPTLSIAGLLRIADKNDFKYELNRWKSFREIDELTRENAALTREVDQWITEKASKDLHVHHLMLANADLAAKLNLLKTANVALQQQITFREMATANAQSMSMRQIAGLVQQVEYMGAHMHTHMETQPHFLSVEWTEDVKVVLRATREIQTWFRRLCTLRRANVRLQAWFRERLARNILICLRQDKSVRLVSESVLLVQRRFRGARCARRYGMLRCIVLRLQTVYRCTKRLRVALVLQPIVRGFVTRRRLAAQAKAAEEAKAKAVEEAVAAEAKAVEEAVAAEAKAVKSSKAKAAKAAKTKATEVAKAKAAKAAQLEAEAKAARQAEAKKLKENKEERHRRVQLLREETRHRVVAERSQDKTAKQIRGMSEEEILNKQFLVKEINLEEVDPLEAEIDVCMQDMLTSHVDFFSLDMSRAVKHLVDNPGVPVVFEDPRIADTYSWEFMMMLMQFDCGGHEFKVYSHAFWKAQTLALSAKAKSDLTFTIDMMDKLPSNPYLRKFLKHILHQNLVRPPTSFPFAETSVIARIYLEKLPSECQERIDLFLYVAGKPHVNCMAWFPLEEAFVHRIYMQCDLEVTLLKYLSKTVDTVPVELLERIVQDTDMMVEVDETKEAVKMLAKLKRPLVSFTEKMLYAMTRCVLSPNYIKLLFVCIFMQLSNADVRDIKFIIAYYEEALRKSYMENYSDHLALLFSRL